MLPSGWIGAGIVAVVVALTFLALAWVVVSVVIGRLVRHAPAGERPVLPSHYSSLLQHDRAHYPGSCPSCGTDNEPGYRFCRECARELPSSADYDGERDVGTIFGE